MTSTPPGRQIYLNLPVEDLPRARAFYTALGFNLDLRFTDDNAACVIIEPDRIYVMLLVRSFFETFTRRAICETGTHTEALVALSCASREAVDALRATALANGGADTGLPTRDLGFMYQSSFYDPDGHHWELGWMDPAFLADLPAAS